MSATCSGGLGADCRADFRQVLVVASLPPRSLFGLLGLEFQGDFPHAHLLGHRYGYFHYAVLEAGLYLVDSAAFGQHESPFEGAVHELAADIVLRLCLLGRLALALDGEQVVENADFELLRLDPRQVNPDDDISFARKALDPRVVSRL